MLVCSSDGTVAFFQFEKNEMGDPMSVEDKVFDICELANCAAPNAQVSTVCRKAFQNKSSDIGCSTVDRLY